MIVHNECVCAQETLIHVIGAHSASREANVTEQHLHFAIVMVPPQEKHVLCMWLFWPKYAIWYKR